MKIMAIDYGDARTGFAISDRSEFLASPIGTVPERNVERLADKAAQTAAEYGAGEIIVGLPINMNGTEGPRAEKCRAFAELLKERTDLPVRMWDERSTTVTAHNILNETNVRGKARKAVVDTVAATIILEGYLEYRRKKAMLKKVHKKAGIAFLCVMAALAVLAGRIAWINYNHGDAYSKAVLDHQTYTSTTIPYKRGQILTSNGNILAYSERVYNLILDPKLVLSDEKYKEPTLNALVQCFGLNRQELEQTLAVKKDSQYERLAMGLTSDEIADFKALVADTKNNPNIKGVWFENSYVRKYPFSTMACDVVGFASAANGGELGLESYYDDELSGTDGVSYSYVNDNLDVQETTKDAVDGNNIVTTIDYNVQRIIEKHIAAYNEEKPSSATAVLVMNPNNGEVLGMASYPYFDLNNPRSLESSYSQEQLATMSDEDMTNSLYKIWRNYLRPILLLF